jgi:hypothetical protein
MAELAAARLAEVQARLAAVRGAQASAGGPGATAEGRLIVCTLDADGGDLTGRVVEWHCLLGQATGREAIEGGIAVTFEHDVARTAELARLMAAEYACCSFASYHLTIDARGVRMEVRAPEEGRDALVAMFGPVG